MDSSIPAVKSEPVQFGQEKPGDVDRRVASSLLSAGLLVDIEEWRMNDASAVPQSAKHLGSISAENSGSADEELSRIPAAPHDATYHEQERMKRLQAVPVPVRPFMYYASALGKALGNPSPSLPAWKETSRKRKLAVWSPCGLLIPVKMLWWVPREVITRLLDQPQWLVTVLLRLSPILKHKFWTYRKLPLLYLQGHKFMTELKPMSPLK